MWVLDRIQKTISNAFKKKAYYQSNTTLTSLLRNDAVLDLNTYYDLYEYNWDIRQAIKQNENAVVVVMGCYAQLKPEDIKNIEGVDVLIGTSNRHKIYDLVMEAINNKKSIYCVDEILDVLFEKFLLDDDVICAQKEESLNIISGKVSDFIEDFYINNTINEYENLCNA